VTIDWLVASEKAERFVSEDPYIVGTPSKKRGAKIALDANKDDSRKRAKNRFKDDQCLIKQKAGKLRVDVDEQYHPCAVSWQGNSLPHF
jgi:hypothetical protein